MGLWGALGAHCGYGGALGGLWWPTEVMGGFGGGCGCCGGPLGSHFVCPPPQKWRDIVREVRLLQRLSHPHTVRGKGAFLRGHCVWVRDGGRGGGIWGGGG